MVNYHALQANFFFERFLGFIERYDDVTNANMIHNASKWVKAKDVNSIYTCLKLSLFDPVVYFTYSEFSNLTEEELLALLDFSKKVVPLIDEEKALCHELCGYMGKVIY